MLTPGPEKDFARRVESILHFTDILSVIASFVRIITNACAIRHTGTGSAKVVIWLGDVDFFLEGGVVCQRPSFLSVDRLFIFSDDFSCFYSVVVDIEKLLGGDRRVFGGRFDLAPVIGAVVVSILAKIVSAEDVSDFLQVKIVIFELVPGLGKCDCCQNGDGDARG